MSTITLNAEPRTIKGRKTNQLRAEGKVPAVVYGAGTESKPITIEQNQFLKTYKQAGESMIIELKVNDDKPLHVLVHDYQLDPVRDEVTHVDFRSIDMDKEIDAVVALEFIGESAAVKALGGTLLRPRDSVTVHCLPSKLMRTLSVDLSKLETFEDVVNVSDIDLPEGVSIVDDGNLTVAVVSKPRTAQELAELDEEIEGEAGEAAAEDEDKEGETKEGAEAEGDKPKEGEEEKASE